MINILGNTLFDLENVCEITAIKDNSDYGDIDDLNFAFWIVFIRGNFRDRNCLKFETQAEAESARAELEQAVMKAKGIVE